MKKPRFKLGSLVFSRTTGMVGRVREARDAADRKGATYIISGPACVFEAKSNDVVPLRKTGISPKKLGSKRPLKNGTLATLAIRGFPNTADGSERYEVNWTAIDPPAAPRPPRPKKETPFVRVTVANATREQVRNALHRALIRDK